MVDNSKSIDESVSIGRMWHWFSFFWRGHLGVLLLILIMSVFTAALVVAFPWMWQYIIEQAEGAETTVSIRTLAGWMVAVGAGQMVVYFILQGARSVMNSRVEWLARRRVFARVTEMTTKVHSSYGVGDIVTRLSNMCRYHVGIVLGLASIWDRFGIILG